MTTERELHLLRTARAAGIVGRTEQANLMAQVGHESSGLSRLEESFRYSRSAEQVSAVVRSAMREGRATLEAARLEALEGRPQALAELMYGGRMGNNQPGDGYLFRGRGYMQLTGRENYRAAGDALGIDLERSPQLAAEPQNAARIAVWYWQTRVPVHARDTVQEAGAAINGRDPPNGLADRERRFAHWERTLEERQAEVIPHGNRQRDAPVTVQAALVTDRRASPHGTPDRSFDDVMRVMLPTQHGVAPHMTSDFGHRTLNGTADHHGGVDFNYVGGQNGVNRRHPTVHSPVSGIVIFGAGQGSYGTVKIRDDQGNTHEILHLDSRSVRVTEPPTRVNAGDPIGTMGGRGPGSSSDYAQHVHYQVRDRSKQAVDPEEFWRNRSIGVPGTSRDDKAPVQPQQLGNRQEPIADGVLRKGERGDDIVGLQQSLNRLGARDAAGNRLVEDGRYGERTFEAIEAYQRANNLRVDGVAGPRTLESIGNRLPPGTVSVDAVGRTATASPGLTSDPVYVAFRQQLPATVTDAQAMHVALAARQNGIDSPDKLKVVTVQGNDAFVMGTTPGVRAKVDLSQPAPAPSDAVAQLTTRPDPQMRTVVEPQRAMTI